MSTTVSEIQAFLQAEINALPVSDPEVPDNLKIKEICQGILDDAVNKNTITAATQLQIKEVIASHNRYETAYMIIGSAPEKFQEELAATFRTKFNPAKDKHPSVPQDIVSFTYERYFGLSRK